MTRYVDAISDFCTDPVTGERRTIDYFMFGTCLVFSPILGPIYYLGLLGSALRANREGEA